ncbi:MAG: hypothetical protein GC204_14930 [Chloroflexi bacterium]|nr:hypothetical protein [Chloroflexota bacterium]
MTSEIYYPEQRHLLAKTAIRRERFLPDSSSGDVMVNSGTRVSVLDVVARGPSPSPYMLIEAARFFDLKNPDKLFDLLDVRIGEQVGTGDILAGKPGRRGKKLLSPVAGKIVDITQGRIVLQEVTPPVEIEAGLNGSVTSVRKGRGVVIEAYGGILQGVWGNDRRAIGTIRHEPSDGMENIYGDMVNTQYRGAVLVTRRPLKRVSFQVIEDQSFIAVIAPSFEPDLMPVALESRAAILLTESFGSSKMSNVIAQFLDTMEGRQATVDAALPAPLETRRPEVIINVPIEPGERPAGPNLSASLRNGREVRLTRGAYSGMSGYVIGLPKEPVSLDNGLRVACAQVELVTGEKINVPLANIEVSG